MVMNMAGQGVLGKIVHCKGGYLHDSRSEVAGGKETAITVSEIIYTEIQRTTRPTN